MSKEKATLDKKDKEVKEEKDIQEEVQNEEIEDTETDSEESEDESEENDLEIQLAEAKDKYLRLYSEFENFRRRTSKEKIDLINTAGRKVIEGILPVLDDFERAIKAKKEAGEDEEEGIGLIYNKLKKTLESSGLKPMDTKPGDEFNDEFHEAITQIPAPEKRLAGKIVDVIEPGYFLNDTVIRFAKVVTGAK